MQNFEIRKQWHCLLIKQQRQQTTTQYKQWWKFIQSSRQANFEHKGQGRPWPQVFFFFPQFNLLKRQYPWTNALMEPISKMCGYQASSRAFLQIHHRPTSALFIESNYSNYFHLNLQMTTELAMMVTGEATVTISI